MTNCPSDVASNIAVIKVVSLAQDLDADNQHCIHYPSFSGGEVQDLETHERTVHKVVVFQYIGVPPTNISPLCVPHLEYYDSLA